MTSIPKKLTSVLAVATLLSLAITFFLICATTIAMAQDGSAGSNNCSMATCEKFTELAIKLTKVEDAIGFIYLLGGVIVAVFTIVGALFAMYEGWQSRKYADNAERNAESAKTVALVNETLKIAKDANERATESLQRQAAIEQEQLDNTVMRLIRDNNFFDVGAIMAQNNKQVRATIVRVFDNLIRLDLFEKALGLSATPSCSRSFLKGMKCYFDDDFKEALEHWHRSGEIADNDRVSAIALYWAGHLQNNMGMFDAAERNFGAAMTRLTNVVDNEIGRNECARSVIEAKFFNKDRYSPANLRNEVEETIKLTHGELARARMKLLAGHIYYMSGIEEQIYNPEAANTYFDKAIEHYQTIEAGTSKFALYGKFGYALTWVARHTDPLPSDVIDRLKLVKERFLIDASLRSEPRSKVTSQTVALVCDKHLGNSMTARDTIIAFVEGNVDIVLWVYSPITKRNVSKDEFVKELKAL